MLSQEKSASAQLPAGRVWLQRGEGLAKALAAAAGGIARMMRRGYSTLERAQGRRMALRELYALDDRTLQDIGLSRELVPATVSAMLGPKPVAQAMESSREVNAGDAADIPSVDTSNDASYKSAA